MSRVLDWVFNRLRERSTWAGIISLVGAFGVVIKPELSEHIIAVAMLLLGGGAAVTKEKGSPDAP